MLAKRIIPCLDMVERVADEVFIPLTVGGGIRTVEDVRRLLNAGADKVSIDNDQDHSPRSLLMHKLELDDEAKEPAHADSAESNRLSDALDKLNLRIEQRHPGKPIVCEVIGSTPLELVVVIPGDEGSYTLQALRPLTEGESITLKRRDHAQVVTGTLYHCRKAQRAGDHPNLYLAGLKTAPGAFQGAG